MVKLYCCSRPGKHSCRCWLWLRTLLLLHSFHFTWVCFMLQMAYGLKVLSHRLCSAGRLLQLGWFDLHFQSCCLTPWAEEAVDWVEVSCALLGGARCAWESFAWDMESLNGDSVLPTAPSLCKEVHDHLASAEIPLTGGLRDQASSVHSQWQQVFWLQRLPSAYLASTAVGEECHFYVTKQSCYSLYLCFKQNN